MVHPSDRKLTYHGEQRSRSHWPWLLVPLVAASSFFGFLLFSGPRVTLVPLMLCLFSILIYLLRVNHEVNRKAKAGLVAAPHDEIHRDHEIQVQPAPPQQDLASMRMIYDRFDPTAIRLARSNGLEARASAGFLDFARNYVDTDHASALLAAGNETELGKHLQAAIERAWIAYDMQEF